MSLLINPYRFAPAVTPPTIRGRALETYSNYWAYSTYTAGSRTLAQADFNTPPASGDLVLFLYFSLSDEVGGAPVGSFSGMSQAAFASEIPGAEEVALVVQTKIAGGSEGTYTPNANTGQYAEGIAAIAIPGGREYEIGELTAGFDYTGAGTSRTIPGVTAPEAGCLLLSAFWAFEDEMTGLTVPSGMTLLGTTSIASPTPAKLAIAYETLAAAGATGDRVWTGAASPSGGAGANLWVAPA